MAFYFAKCVGPMNLLFFYPKWTIDSHSLGAFLPWAVLIGVVGWLWHRRATWGRHALLGLGFFLINLAPFVGFTSVSYMGMTWVMDHFAYLPLVGLIGLAVAALEDIDRKLSPRARPALFATVAVILAGLAWGSETYAATFAGPEALWSHTVAGNPSSAIAHSNLGAYLFQTGRALEATAEFKKAVALDPNSAESDNNLGFALEQSGHADEAMDYFRQALQLNPHFNTARTNLADALFRAGRMPEALDNYQQALLVNPKDEYARAQVAKIQAMLKTPWKTRE
jgi:hypothetical protein